MVVELTQELSAEISVGTKQYVGLGVAVEIETGTELRGRFTNYN